jgi:hypothetical protein
MRSMAEYMYMYIRMSMNMNITSRSVEKEWGGGRVWRRSGEE